MTELAAMDLYGELIEPATLRIERLLPGTVERVWAYLTDSDLRRKWLAAGEMELRVGAPFELVWRNAELTNPPGRRPEGFPDEHRMQGHITEVDPPRRLAITWGEGERGGVTFDLAPMGREVMLTIVHRRLPDRSSTLNVAAGWHAHLDMLVALARGDAPEPFWDKWVGLKAQYETRLPAS